MQIRKIAKWMLLVCAVMLLLSSTAFAMVTSNVVVSQVAQDGNGITVYANLLDSFGNPSGEVFSGEKFSVLIDGQAMQTNEVSNFNMTGEGVYYVVCVDVSKSLNDNDMANIRTALSNFVMRMSANDRLSIITFGTDVHTLIEGSSDQNALLSHISNLKPTDQKTQLYEAIYTALTIARTKSPEMPKRSVVLILTDGTDDPNPGKEGIYTFENIVNIVDESNIPIYTVAVKKNNQVLENLRTFAQLSGGALNNVDTGFVADSVDQLRMMVRNTTVLRVPIVNENGQKGLRAHSFSVVLDIGDVKLTSKEAFKFTVDWDMVAVPTMVPTATPTVTPTPFVSAAPVVVQTPPPTIPLATTAAPTAEPTAEPTPTAAPWPQSWFNQAKGMMEGDTLLFVGAAVFLLIALLILLIVILGGKKKNSQMQLTPLKSDDDARTTGGTILNTAGTSKGRDEQKQGDGTVMINTAHEEGPTTTVQNNNTGSGTVMLSKKKVPEATGGSGTVLISARNRGLEMQIEEYRGNPNNSTVKTVFLKTQLIIGREEGCDYVVKDGAVSSKHLKITREGNTIYATDMNSSNGTVINDKEAEANAAVVIGSGDIINIGETTLKIHFKL